VRALLLIAAAACGRDHFDPAHNYAFVTSKVYDVTTFGNDGAGGDAACTAAASDAGLLGGFVAYIATTGLASTARLGNSRGWVRTDGKPFVDRVEDLAAGTIFYPLRVDELGEDVGTGAGPIATGAAPGGKASMNCSDWSDPAPSAVTGLAQNSGGGWSSFTDTACSMPMRVYCFGTGLDTPLEVAAPAHDRTMFITANAFPIAGGLAGADMLCQSEATEAGLAGTFQAMLPTLAASALSRFDQTGPTWARVDGVELADSPLALASGTLLATPNVTASGAHVSTDVLSPALPGLVPLGTCNDWAGEFANTGGGLPISSGPDAFSLTTHGCVPAPIYCFER
jgi:hypothetical protein